MSAQSTLERKNPLSETGPKTGEKPKKRRLKKYYGIYLALLPTFLFLLIFNYYPAISAIYHSFYEWNGANVEKFTWLENFRTMGKDPILISSIWNAVKLMIWGVIVSVTAPLIAAELVYNLKSEKAQYLFRLAFIIPMVVPAMVSLLIWQFIYDADMGLINQLLNSIGLAHLAVPWLGDQRFALYAIMFRGFPWVAGFSFLIYLAGLQNIPNSLVDASRIDGASKFKRFYTIDIPLIMGQIKLLVILAVIGALQDFVAIMVMTDGGPGYATMTPGLHMYKSAFLNDRLGYACSIGLVIFIVILALTYINMKYITSSIEYGEG